MSPEVSTAKANRVAPPSAASARPAPTGTARSHGVVAQQLGHRQGARLLERRSRERQRDQKTKTQRIEPVEGMERRRDGERQGVAENVEQQRRQRQPRRRARERRDESHNQDLDQHKACGLAAAGAERFENGEGIALAVDERAHRIGDADAAADKRRQADQGDELGEALDVARQLRRRIGAAANFVAGIRETRGKLLFHRLDPRVIGAGQEQAKRGARQRSGLYETARGQSFGRQQHMRREGERAQRIRLAAQPGGDDETRVANEKRVAERKFQPRPELRIDGDAKPLFPARQQLGERRLRLGLQRADQRIGAVHAFQFD